MLPWRRATRVLRRNMPRCVASAMDMPSHSATASNARLAPSPSRTYTYQAHTPPQLTVADLLAISKEFRSKQTHFILENETLGDAIKYLAKNENSATLVVVDAHHKVVGLLTNHLVLERISKIKTMEASNARLLPLARPPAEQGAVNEAAASPLAVASGWDTKVVDIAIPAHEVLYVAPDDSLEECRAVMALSGRGELPVLERGKLLGTVSLIDIASLLHRKDVQMNHSPTSAKSDYINVILPRKGIPQNTSLDEASSLDLKEPGEEMLYILHSFAMSIPHPAKKTTGGEDAYFVGTLHDGVDEWDESAGVFKQVYGPTDILSLGVADGVGSWFEKGISAKLFAQELMKAAHKAVQISVEKERIIDPGEVLHAAWSTVLQKEIVGSSTACVLSLDPRQGELHAVNLGDSGFLIIRDSKSDLKMAKRRGTLDGAVYNGKSRDDDNGHDSEQASNPTRKPHNARVSYRSPQQLHYFNCPFQLGFVGNDIRHEVSRDLAHAAASSSTPLGERPLFETPQNAVRLRVPVMDGDLVLLATDGLFDNVDEDVLLQIINDQPDVEAMTRQLVQKAYELSLDRKRDSPFARLAKENDLLWGGGMPDDITVIVARVRRVRAAAAAMNNIALAATS